jgi:hypothetical protein
MSSTSTVEYTRWVTIMHMVLAGVLYVFTPCGLIGTRRASVHTEGQTLHATSRNTD